MSYFNENANPWLAPQTEVVVVEKDNSQEVGALKAQLREMTWQRDFWEGTARKLAANPELKLDFDFLYKKQDIERHTCPTDKYSFATTKTNIAKEVDGYVVRVTPKMKIMHLTENGVWLEDGETKLMKYFLFGTYFFNRTPPAIGQFVRVIFAGRKSAEKDNWVGFVNCDTKDFAAFKKESLWEHLKLRKQIFSCKNEAIVMDILNAFTYIVTNPDSTDF